MKLLTPDRVLDLLHSRTRWTDDGCLEWIGARTKAGYGLLGSGTYAHRAAYLVFVGPIPDGLELDHLCRNRACCNWAHLEAVTHAENMRRGYRAMKTHCPKGHAYEGDNYFINKINGGRQCRLCKNERRRKGDKPRSKTHCPQGHEFTPENTMSDYCNGARRCRTCVTERRRAWRQRQKEALA